MIRAVVDRVMKMMVMGMTRMMVMRMTRMVVMMVKMVMMMGYENRVSLFSTVRIICSSAYPT